MPGAPGLGVGRCVALGAGFLLSPHACDFPLLLPPGQLSLRRDGDGFVLGSGGDASHVRDVADELLRISAGRWRFGGGPYRELERP